MLESEYDRPELLCFHFVKKPRAESRLPLCTHRAAVKLCSRNSVAPNPHGKWKVAGLIAYWQAAWRECVHDQEAPTCSNVRCGEGDRRETKGMHNTWNKTRKERSSWQRSLENIPREEGGSFMLFPERDPTLTLTVSECVNVELWIEMDDMRAEAAHSIGGWLQQWS